MSVERNTLATRVQAVLSGRSVREVSMFGGLSFMVDDSIVVAARRDGDLLVRIDSSRHDELLGVAGAAPALMDADRPMGPGWITVSQEGVTSRDQLAFWIEVGLESQAARKKGSQ